MKIINLLKNIKQGLLINRNEPRVKQKRDCFGNKYWQVYDYKSDRFYSFGSDEDVRIWIENRHHYA